MMMLSLFLHATAAALAAAAAAAEAARYQVIERGGGATDEVETRTADNI